MAAKPKAKESPQILKARQKIEQQLAENKKQVNPEALNYMNQIIKRQLARHKADRIDLKSRNIVPTAAQTENKFVLRLLRHLKAETSPSENHLEGRVKNIHEKF